MIEDFKKVEELFQEVNLSMHRKTDMYIIGGAALLHRGMKTATKDIDMVVATKQEFIELQKALERTGFAPQLPGKEYTRMNLSQVFQRGEFRIDLFEKEVCGGFSLSENMRKRAEKAIELTHLNVFLCSNEDIFLFKTMTGREGDLTDCISIASTTDPDWNSVLEELKDQMHQSKQDVWTTWVGERLDLLQERGLLIPIMGDVDKLRDAFFDNLEKKQGEELESEPRS